MSYKYGMIFRKNKKKINVNTSNRNRNNQNNIDNNASNKIHSISSRKVTGFWGTPAWNFFHCLSEKIDETYYSNNYKTIFDIIKSIFECIPCPICREHAINKINSNNFNVDSLNTKEKLKMFFFNFHNEVNKRTKAEAASIQILDNYVNKDMKTIYHIFLRFFFKSCLST